MAGHADRGRTNPPRTPATAPPGSPANSTASRRMPSGAWPSAARPSNPVTPPAGPRRTARRPGQGGHRPQDRERRRRACQRSTPNGASCARPTRPPAKRRMSPTEEARAHPEGAHRRDASGTPAEMTDGSPCPVCGSLDHPDPVDPASNPPVSRDEEEPPSRSRTPRRRQRTRREAAVAAVDAVLSDLERRLATSASEFTAGAGTAGRNVGYGDLEYAGAGRRGPRGSGRRGRAPNRGVPTE